jgi:hypothetical protein
MNRIAPNGAALAGYPLDVEMGFIICKKQIIFEFIFGINIEGVYDKVDVC